MDTIVQWSHVVASLIYAGVGILILIISFVVIEKLTPQNLWTEIWKNKNVALAILFGAYMLAVAIIVAAAIH